MMWAPGRLGHFFHRARFSLNVYKKTLAIAQNRWLVMENPIKMDDHV